MFNFFRRSKKTQVHTPLDDEYKGDRLDQSMTEIAIQLINGQGGSEFRGYFISLFKNEPRFVKDVAPEYREALRLILEENELGSCRNMYKK